jgi:hypothetical protein
MTNEKIAEANMSIICLAEKKVENQVDRLFRENPPLYGQYCINPVTAAPYVGGLDPVEPQKAIARRALLARDWFAINGPPDVQPLPLSSADIADLKYRAPLSHIVSCFAYSLRSLDWDINRHPNFDDFARGVIASGYACRLAMENNMKFGDDEVLRRRYPPRRLAGLGPWLVWELPAVYARTMEEYQRHFARSGRAA